MGASHGVGIILKKKCAAQDLEPIVATEIGDLRSLDVSFSIHRAGPLTLLAQSGSDDDRLFFRRERVSELAAALAEQLDCRAWSFAGYGGAVSEVFIDAFDADGSRWSEQNEAGAELLQSETELPFLPWEAGTVPFLTIDRPWVALGELSLAPGLAFAPATAANLRSVFGRAVQAPGAFFSKLSVDEFELQLVTLKLGPKVSLDALGLVEQPRGPSWPPSRLGVAQPLPLPDGTRPRTQRRVTGVACEEAGDHSRLRWAVLFPPEKGRTATWVQVGLAVGPFSDEIEALEDFAEENEQHQR